MVALKQRSRSSFQNIIRFRDTESRPLGEGKLPPDLTADVPMTMRTCSYPGGRFQHPHPMNISALQQVNRHWDAGRALIGWLRRLHLDSSGADRVTLSGLWRIGRLGQSLPAWMLLRRAAPVADGGIPPAIAAVFKIVVGMNFAIQSLHLKTVFEQQYDETAAATTAALMEHIENHNLLIGPTEVCAGPRNMIAEMFDLLIDGGAHPIEPTEIDPAAAALIGDVAGFVAYADQAMRFQAAAYVAELFNNVLALGVIAKAIAAPDASPARRAASDLQLALSSHSLLTSVMYMPPPQVIAFARSVHRFMAGPQPDGDPTSAQLERLIETWLRPRFAADAQLMAFPGTGVPVALLTAHLALDRHWLELNRIGDTTLERHLGHDPAPRSLAELDAGLGDTALRRCLEAVFNLAIRHDDDGASLERGGHARRIAGVAL